jgi:hypothetical protein
MHVAAVLTGWQQLSNSSRVPFSYPSVAVLHTYLPTMPRVQMAQHNRPTII